MNIAAPLAEYGLAQCRRCRRVLLTEHLERGRCRPGLDCAAFEFMRECHETGNLEVAAGVERGLNDYEERR